MSMKTNQSGFALLMTIIVVSIMVSIGLTILDISLKTITLSNNAAQSEIAFHAANAGMECARYTRRQQRPDFIEGNDVTFDCLGSSVTSVEGDNGESVIGSGISANSQVYTYRFKITHGTPQRCSEGTVVILDSEVSQASIDNTDAETFFPWEDGPFTCPLFSVCTLAFVRGYNTSCSNVDSGAGQFLQREILLKF